MTSAPECLHVMAKPEDPCTFLDKGRHADLEDSANTRVESEAAETSRSSVEAETLRSSAEAETSRSSAEAETSRSSAEAETSRSSAESETSRSSAEAEISRSSAEGSSGKIDNSRNDNTDSGINQEYEKPPYSPIALVSMALLEAKEKKCFLGDIYEYVMNKFPFYRFTADKAWQNYIRHTLSLNKCFIKAGRENNRKGNYWAIHPACIEDFSKGDFRRRQSRQRARRSKHPTVRQAAQRQHLSNVEMTPLSYLPLGTRH